MHELYTTVPPVIFWRRQTGALQAASRRHARKQAVQAQMLADSMYSHCLLPNYCIWLTCEHGQAANPTLAVIERQLCRTIAPANNVCQTITPAHEA